MFKGFTKSDFKCFDGTKSPQDKKIKIVKEKLKDLRKDLLVEIEDKWNRPFKSDIGGLFPYNKDVYGIWVAFTERVGKSYTYYPQLNIEIKEDGFYIFFILYGFESGMVKPDNQDKSRTFHDNFISNAKNNKELIDQLEIDLDFKDDQIYVEEFIDYSEIIKTDKNNLINSIFTIWDLYRPLYDMAMENSINIPDSDGQNKIFEKYEEEGRIKVVTFHPSYSYEEFVEGIKAHSDGNGNIDYKVEDGIFKRICKIAKKSSPNEPYILIIDEINRGNVSKIFGELITLLEPDKRLGESNELIVTLPYSKEKFGIPSNLYIIGTMNTADRSIALMDTALRRRFSFMEFSPDFDLARKTLKPSNGDVVDLSIRALEKINATIRNEYHKLGKDKQIGHSYIYKMESKNKPLTQKDNALMIWRYEILPLLEEYFYGRYDDLENILGNNGKELVDTEFKCIKDFSHSQLETTLQALIGIAPQIEQDWNSNWF